MILMLLTDIDGRHMRRGLFSPLSRPRRSHLIKGDKMSDEYREGLIEFLKETLELLDPNHQYTV